MKKNELINNNNNNDKTNGKFIALRLLTPEKPKKNKMDDFMFTTTNVVTRVKINNRLEKCVWKRGGLGKERERKIENLLNTWPLIPLSLSLSFKYHNFFLLLLFSIFFERDFPTDFLLHETSPPLPLILINL